MQLCSNALASGTEAVLSHHVGGNAVVAISDQLVVKFGGAVTSHEFDNQKIAHRLLLQEASIGVPKPYCFFQKGHVGYLVMDYIKEDTESSDSLSALEIVELLRVFATIRSDRPGSLGGGPCCGLLWSEYHSFTPERIDDVEKHFSERLRGVSDLALSPYPAVLHHGDLAARNITKKGDRLYILDWASAGYFPRLFEVAAMRRTNCDPLILDVLDLMDSIAWLSEDESAQVDHIVKAASSNIRYVV